MGVKSSATQKLEGISKVMRKLARLVLLPHH
jgi:hypothetical protein